MQKVKLENGNKLVLEPYHQGTTGNYKNLKKVSGKKVIWEAELPSKSFQDAYVSFEIIDGKLWANTFEGHRCEVDVDSGKVLQEMFVK